MGGIVNKNIKLSTCFYILTWSCCCSLMMETNKDLMALNADNLKLGYFVWVQSQSQCFSKCSEKLATSSNLVAGVFIEITKMQVLREQSN